MKSVKRSGRTHEVLSKGLVSVALLLALFLPQHVHAGWKPYLYDFERTNHSPTEETFTPESIWQRSTTGIFYRMRRISTPSVAPPVIHKGVLYEGTPQGRLLAIELSAHRTLWKFKAPYGIDAPATVVDGMVCVATVGGTLHCLETDTGKELWQFQATSEILASPVIEGEFVYINSASGRVYALSRYTGEKLWSYTHRSAHYVVPRLRTSPAVDERRLFVLFPDGWLVALDKKTGKELWKKELFRIDEALNIPQARRTPTVAEGILYVLDRKGRLLLLSVEDGKELDRYPVAGLVDFTVTAKRLYIATSDTVTAVNSSTGGRRWRVRLEGKKIYSVLSTERYVVVLSNEEKKRFSLTKKKRIKVTGSIDILDTETGRIIWTDNLPHRVRTHAALEIPYLAVVTTKGRLVVVSQSLGR